MGVLRGYYSYLSPGRGINLTPPALPKNRIEGPAYHSSIFPGAGVFIQIKTYRRSQTNEETKFLELRHASIVNTIIRTLIAAFAAMYRR